MFSVGLQKLIDERGISRKEIADVIGQSVSQVGMYIQGRRDPCTDVLLKLSHHYDVSVDSLLMNDSPKYSKSNTEQKEMQLVKDFSNLPLDVQQDICNLMQHIIRKKYVGDK